ncbi:hypothetical protein M885DRAFT_528203 [Pelagophyceae sp. CCMP2097]|nr:hypothetical protein M885DRAFT_528203 [Pelagophyceae sp. CCMP2097]|eukprot:CAMPEP_0184232248 /NCGR_PEP_ID=MMETSP0976-20121227/23690_1 /TAXON_ID=483370 /ORGANISM="non described non described, Strain CCMP2097" /LENGTH=397 /DNA_ID=CAMNT_0026537263 /DNA_START=14 /DNA_END=1207 /DNA_ORIENTATION=-
MASADEKRAEAKRVDALFSSAADLARAGSAQGPAAFEMLSEAARCGSRKAQTALGAVFEAGTAVPMDLPRAAQLYTDAAERRAVGAIGGEAGWPEAQYRLGLLYADGRGVKRDNDEASVWLMRAAKSGHVLALKALAEMKKKASATYRLKALLCGARAAAPALKRAVDAFSPKPPALKRQEEVKSPPILKKVASRAVQVANADKAQKRLFELDAEAKLALKQRDDVRSKVGALRGELLDVTFHEPRLGIALCLATDHRTQRKMIIVERVDSDSPACGVLRPQDELVAVENDFDLPHHILTFADVARTIRSKPRPLTLTFARLHAHRPEAKGFEELRNAAPEKGAHALLLFPRSSLLLAHASDADAADGKAADAANASDAAAASKSPSRGAEEAPVAE